VHVNAALLSEDVAGVVVTGAGLPASFTAYPDGVTERPSGGPIRNRVDILLHHTDALGQRWVFLPRRTDGSLVGADLPLPGAEHQGFRTVRESAILAGFDQLGLALDVSRFRSLAGPDIELIIAGEVPAHHNVRVLAYEVNGDEHKAMRLSTVFAEGRWFLLHEARNPASTIHPALREVLERLWDALDLASDFDLANPDPRRRIYEAFHRGDVGETVARSTLILASEMAEEAPEPDPENYIGCLVKGCQRLGDHYHPHPEMFVVLAGRVVVFLAHKDDPNNITGPFIFGVGESFTVPAFVIHTVFCDPGTILSAIVTWDVKDNLIKTPETILVIPGIDVEPVGCASDDLGLAEELGTEVLGQFSTGGALAQLQDLRRGAFPAGSHYGMARTKPVIRVAVLPVEVTGGMVGLCPSTRPGLPDWWLPEAAMEFGTFEGWALSAVRSRFVSAPSVQPLPNQLRPLPVGNVMWPATGQTPLQPQQDVYITFALLLGAVQLDVVRMSKAGDFRWFDPMDVVNNHGIHPFIRRTVETFVELGV
jgi:mannose-6-phosphate isomerase-like protein (cupin superfamily)